jgi:hypothetical protein
MDGWKGDNNVKLQRKPTEFGDWRKDRHTTLGRVNGALEVQTIS